MSDPYAPPQVENVAAPEEISEELPYPNAPVGVGGWLRFYCIIVAIIAPLVLATQLVKAYPAVARAWSASSPGLGVFLAEQSLFSIGTIIGLISGFLFWRKHPRAVVCAKLYLMARFLGIVMDDAIHLFHFGNTAPDMLGAQIGQMLPYFLKESAFFLLWWFYFKKSKRVANTFPQSS